MSNTKARKMVAKFNGRCPACETAIAAGEEIVFYADRQPGRKAWHVDCARIDVLPTKIFAAGMLAMKNGGMDETHYAAIEKELSAELETLKAARSARLDAAVAA